jgi:hypothetical protein
VILLRLHPAIPYIAVEAKVRTFPNAEIHSEITSDFLLTRSAILRLLYKYFFYINVMVALKFSISKYYIIDVILFFQDLRKKPG